MLSGVAIAHLYRKGVGGGGWEGEKEKIRKKQIKIYVEEGDCLIERC